MNDDRVVGNGAEGGLRDLHAHLSKVQPAVGEGARAAPVAGSIKCAGRRTLLLDDHVSASQFAAQLSDVLDGAAAEIGRRSK